MNNDDSTIIWMETFDFLDVEIKVNLTLVLK